MTKPPKYTLKRIPTSKPIGAFTFDEPLVLKKHEFETIEKLRRFGDPIHRIGETGIMGDRRPDIRWRGEQWEIKSISGNSCANITHALQEAKDQSPNIVLDIVKTKRQPDAIWRDVHGYFYGSKKIKKVMIIIHQNYCIIE